MKKIITLLIVACIFCGCTPAIQQTPHSPTPDNTVTFTATPTENTIPSATTLPTPTPIDIENFNILYVTGSTVNVREAPSKDGKVVTALQLNALVKGYYKENGWYYVDYGNKTYGYIFAEYLSEVPAETPTPLPTATQKLTRDQILDYQNLLTMPNDANPYGSTLEMINSENYYIELYKEKISQVTQKIIEKDVNLGTKVVSLIAKWNEYMPISTQKYLDLVLEFEPDQGTIFNLTCVSLVATDYKELLDYLENVYLMMMGFEGYIDKKADDAQASKEDYEEAYKKLEDNFYKIHNSTVREANNNQEGYGEQCKKIQDWYFGWKWNLYNFMDLKWQILAELDFSKNLKSFEFYKAYDRYEIYRSYNYDFNEILLIMRGETTYAKG